MIRKGEAWGTPVALTGAEPVARTDAELAGLLVAGPDPTILLRGGDLYHSLGGLPSPEPLRLPVDVLAVTADGVERFAVAHVVAHRRWWSGPLAVAMNGTHLGTWNLGPKAHPNDGLVDTTTGALSWRDRLEARRRAPTGTHLPHPSLTTTRAATATWSFERPVPLYLDGVHVGSARHVEIAVIPDRGAVVLA